MLLSEDWLHISWQGVEWVVAAGYEETIPYLLWDKTHSPELFSDCLLLKKSILRTSYLLRISQNHEDTVFVKRHHCRGRQDDLRSLFLPSRAFTEWKVLHRFQQLNLPAPKPLAYAEKRDRGLLRESCFVTSAVLNAHPLTAVFSPRPQTTAPGHDEKALNWSLGLLIARLHNAGVYFRDLHGGNILVYSDPQQNEPALCFVDTEKARFSSRITRGRRIHDLAMLHMSLFLDRGPSLERFLAGYCGATNDAGIEQQELLSAVDAKARAMHRRHLKSRSKRCIKNSTGFGVKKQGTARCYFRKNVPAEHIHEVLKHTPQNEKKQKSRIFNDVIALASETAPAIRYAVVHYQYGRLQRFASLFARTRAKRAWVNAHSLAVRAVPSLRPVVLQETRSGIGIHSSILVLENAEGKEPLDRYFQTRFGNAARGGCFQEQCRFITHLAMSLRRLFDKKIFIATLSAHDILVDQSGEGSWCFYFPFDKKIVFDRSVALPRRVQVLQKLSDDLGPGLSPHGRLRLIAVCSRNLSHHQRKRLIQEFFQLPT